MRGIRLLWLIFGFIFIAFFVKLFNSGNIRRRKLAALGHRTGVRILRLFHIDVLVDHADRLADERPCLILSNHMSYLDILFLAAVKPTMFLSHTGIEREPFIGWVASAAGTYFVDRSTKANLSEEAQKLGEFLQDGNTVTLYPEGTTGDGLGIMPFHSAFINAAVSAGVDVLPICMQYESYNGEPVTLENKDYLVIYGEQPFMPHIMKVYKSIKNARIKISVGQRISGRTHSRKEISAMTRQWMIETYQIISAP
ncbi:MAG: 1-acyl-sn-glycerol-3-phosphate acyltransferase [Deferribacteraceae bacterium]|jgi:1-acyl-sn-glycerol-3-phosphate acyltransferase|nr:1-acyl-sn-glycerol-3-phosphate acyltransferase [Deferribacteraceae bacterium]